MRVFGWVCWLGVVVGGAAMGQTGPGTLPAGAGRGYPIVSTGQTSFYSDRAVIAAPRAGEAFYGQDAQFPGTPAAYRDNGDGTVSDLVTGLMWVKARGSKVTWDEAVAGAATCSAGGHRDWRMPTIKELYSLINFTGTSGRERFTPYIDTRSFGFAYGDTARGERAIDCQDWSATEYLSTTMGGNPTVFGVNFADGRIKGYPRTMGRRAKTLFVRYVRGNPAYGKNDFVDNGNGTISDRATGLMWSKADSGAGMDWPRALAYAQAKNRENYLGHRDWRVPTAKELQSIVDYGRAPEAQDPAKRGPAIDPVFASTKLADGDWPWYWTSTTHLDGPPERQAARAVYVCFGRGTGYMALPPGSELRLLDVHGAGAQRSDPKRGNAADFPKGQGPQGDVIRIENFVRLVRTEG